MIVLKASKMASTPLNYHTDYQMINNLDFRSNSGFPQYEFMVFLYCVC